MTAKLGADSFAGAWIRIHDCVDFLRRLLARVAADLPRQPGPALLRLHQRSGPLPAPGRTRPAAPNLLWVYSYGGTQDHFLNVDTDRVADVFTDEAAITAAGWSSQEASDLLAVLGPRLVGIPADCIPAFLRRLQGRRFSQWQAEVDAERAARRHRRDDADTETVQRQAVA